MTNEKRLDLIDRLKLLDSLGYDAMKFWAITPESTFGIVLNAPTVDAVEVVNSAGCKWYNGEYHTKIMATAIRYHPSGNMDGYELKVNYCPNCGADMR